MKDLEFPTTAEVIGRTFGASIVGNGSAEVRSLAPLDRAGEGTLSFFSNRKFSACLARIKGAVVITSADLVLEDSGLTYIIVPDPQLAFAEIARKFAALPRWLGISPQAFVHPTASLGENVNIAPFAVVGEGASIGSRTTLFPHASVGAFVRVGEDCQIHSQVSLLDHVAVGNRVKIFPGSVVGSDGFGFVAAGSGREEMPQIGTVCIEDDVRIGAGCTIDRATLGETRIGRGTKIDNQVHIGHNCRVGQNCVLCAQVGLSGSVTLEDGVILAGQVGIADHVTIGAGAQMAGQSATSVNLKGGGAYGLTPAVPMREFLRTVRYWRKLPEMFQRLKKVEESIEEGKKDGA